MYLFPVYIKDSTIEGKGVFASQKIVKGEIVWKYIPEHDKNLSEDEYKNLSQEEKQYLEKVAYLSPTSKNYIYPPENDPALYTNHSTDSNNLSIIVNKEISPEPYFVANRDIDTDEELTNNYLEFDEALSNPDKRANWI